jgi:hypothetical protein
VELHDIISQKAELCMTTAVRLSCHTEPGQGQNISTTICLFNSSINFVAKIRENKADITGSSTTVRKQAVTSVNCISQSKKPQGMNKAWEMKSELNQTC